MSLILCHTFLFSSPKNSFIMLACVVNFVSVYFSCYIYNIFYIVQHVLPLNFKLELLAVCLQCQRVYFLSLPQSRSPLTSPPLPPFCPSCSCRNFLSYSFHHRFSSRPLPEPAGDSRTSLSKPESLPECCRGDFSPRCSRPRLWSSVALHSASTAICPHSYTPAEGDEDGFGSTLIKLDTEASTCSYRVIVAHIDRVSQTKHCISETFEVSFPVSEVRGGFFQPLAEPFCALRGPPIGVRGHQEHTHRPTHTLNTQEEESNFVLSSTSLEHHVHQCGSLLKSCKSLNVWF